MPCVLPASQVARLQHPAQLDMSSQTQVPPRHRCPDVHAIPVPHVHAPPDEHPSAVAPHDWHCEPPVPHASPVAGEVHTLPVQHP